MNRVRGVDLARVFLDAFEAEARARTGSPYGWVSAPEDPALIAGVEAVRDAIAEHHKVQWSALIDQAPGAPKVFGVDYTLGEPIPVTPELLGLGDVLGDIATGAGWTLRFETSPPTEVDQAITIGTRVVITATALAGLEGVVVDIYHHGLEAIVEINERSTWLGAMSDLIVAPKAGQS